MLSWDALWPVFGLRVVAGPIELRAVRDDDIPALAELALAGIHEPERMPFAFPWTDAPPDRLPADMARYYWRTRSEFTPAHWSLDLTVRVDGELAGVQGFGSHHDYPVTRTGETGSWLARAHQGRGVGTLMRQAMCSVLFDHLGAQEITSGAFADNPASLAVSRKVGYRDNGMTRERRRPGELAINRKLVLTPEAFVRGPHPVEVEGIVPLRRFLGLDDADTSPAQAGT